MDKIILISILAVLFYFFISRPASRFTAGITSQNYNTPSSCNFEKETRVFPSGKIPGSYLGLSSQELDTLLKRFVDDKVDNLNDLV